MKMKFCEFVDWFGISCMTTDNFGFYLQNRLIQTSQTGGQWYSDTSPFSIPWLIALEVTNSNLMLSELFSVFSMGEEKQTRGLYYKTFYGSNCCRIVIS
jgi:hypothetical protein